eukprot:GHVH01000996.1.p1 GENE.GHVH01000996.1~~GHVH01000996.1.p1  ORF type:complete len:1033 (-),score=154.60 GHVH01000996.1:1110-3947(-)
MADIVFQYMRDSWSNYTGPPDSFLIHIVEIGGGHGRFSYLFLRQFTKYRPMWESLGMPRNALKFIFTDIAVGNVEAMRSHHHFSEFVRDGIMDFGVLDCNALPNRQDVPIYGLSGESFSTATYLPTDQPTVILANYVYDSLKTDYLQVSPSGRLYRAYCSLYSPLESDLQDPTSGLLIGRLSFKWTWKEIDRAAVAETKPTDPQELEMLQHGIDNLHVNYCSHDLRPTLAGFFEGCRAPLSEVTPLSTSDKASVSSGCHVEMDRSRGDPSSSLTIMEPEIEGDMGETPYYLHDKSIRLVLEEYICYASAEQKWLTFTLSLGAIHFMQNLNSFRPCLFLVGDKGYAGILDVHTRRDPHIAIHGSLSFMVNMHAIKESNTFEGGQHISSPYRNNFQIMCLAGPKSPISQTSLLLNKCADVLTIPPDAPLVQLDLSRSHRTGKSLKLILELIRSVGHDTDTVPVIATEIFENDALQTLNHQQRLEQDLMRDLLLIHDNWYYLTDADGSIPITLAHISMRMGRVKHALRFLSDVPDNKRDGPYYANVANCYQTLGDHEEAIRYCDIALEVLPGFVGVEKIKESCQLMKRPLKCAIIGDGSSLDSMMVHHLVMDNRLRIVARGSDVVDSDDIVMTLLQASMTSHPAVYSGEGWLSQLLDNEALDFAVVDQHLQSDSLISSLFRRGIHVFAGGAISDTGSDALVATYIEQRMRQYSMAKFLNWHQFPEMLTADVKKAVQNEIPSVDTVMGVTIDINLHRSDISASDTQQQWAKLMHQTSWMLVRLHELLSHLNMGIKFFSLTKSESAAVGNFSLGVADQRIHCTINCSFSAVPSSRLIMIHLATQHLMITFEADDRIIVAKKPDIRISAGALGKIHGSNKDKERVLCAASGGIKSSLDLFVEHYLQESRAPPRQTEEEITSSSRKLTLGVDHALKFRSIFQLVEGSIKHTS